MRATVESQLSVQLDRRLVAELLDAYEVAKRNYHLGGLRLSAVEGGRFCEAAFRILEQLAGRVGTPLGKQLDTEKLISILANLSSGSHPDAIRLHLPRSLRVVYDIRNKRDAAHLADGIDPNVQDATLVVAILDWVLAEVVRLTHSVTADEASAIVNALVTRQVPIVQEFDGFLKVMNPRLGASDFVMVLLYHRGQSGATLQELKGWVRPKMRSNLARTVEALVSARDLAHFDGALYRITRLGQQYVEREGILSAK